MTNYCNQCGSPQPVGARFCSRCGVAMNTPLPPFSTRPLERPRMGRQLAGVCLALARANGWDVSVVRVLAVLGLCFSGGVFGVAYLACWIGIPDEPLGSPMAPASPFSAPHSDQASNPYTAPQPYPPASSSGQENTARADQPGWKPYGQ